MDEAKASQDFFHAQIPITRAMGVQVVAADTKRFVVEAPVALNHNHMQTGFGGSVNAIATLAGYGCLWMRLRERAADVVIQESSIRFIRPIVKTIRAVCDVAAVERLPAFLEEVRANTTGRIKLTVRVEENGIAAAEFRGTFVALPRSGGRGDPKLQPRIGRRSNG
ncbi:MAG: thioesterase domain-containing protein [Verrucomicrobiota bacterium]|nr:thioesterase domain-containing protein [Verrucomicrobiota bacterium]